MFLSRRSIALFALLAHAGVCAAAGGAKVDEFQDERTGATITVVHLPLTFALERSTLAAHARDYVSLTAVEVDRSGQTQLYLLGFFWSTIDRHRGAAPQLAGSRTLILQADGRPIHLTPDATLPKDLTAGPQLLAPEAAHAERAAYPVTLELLHFIAGSRALTLRIAGDAEDDEAEADTYEIWTDTRSSLQAFANRVGPPPGPRH
jgi:hypothetical protein